MQLFDTKITCMRKGNFRAMMKNLWGSECDYIIIIAAPYYYIIIAILLLLLLLIIILKFVCYYFY